MRETYRILDANLNRAREALRVIEDCGRFALNDAAITAIAKNLRSDLKTIYDAMPTDEMLAARDTTGDVGTLLTSPTEPVRNDLTDVAVAACKRLTESLRTVEEVGKIVVAADQVRHLQRVRYDSYTLEQRLISRLAAAGRFAEARLIVLVSGTGRAGSLHDLVWAVLAGGAPALQLRETGASDKDTLAMAAEVRQMTDETGRLMIVNNRPDIAAMVGADGVHLGQDDLPLADARRLLRPGAVVGRSTHTPEQVRIAATEGADYISVGPIFETTTKDAGPPVGVDLVARAVETVTVPVIAIGGITAENVSQVVAAGASGVAVCSAVCGADDPRSATEAVLAAME